MTHRHQKTCDDDDTSVSLAVSRVSLRQGKVNSPTKEAHPPPKTPHVTPSTFSRAVGVRSAAIRARASNYEKEQFDDTSSRRQYPTEPATSRHGSSARFNVDVGYVIIDVSLLRRRVATRGRGCRPQRVYLRRNKSTRGRNALASTASPNEPITLPLARGHLLLDGQCLKRAHRCGGG